jgi:hypothetical protein
VNEYTSIKIDLIVASMLVDSIFCGAEMDF